MPPLRSAVEIVYSVTQSRLSTSATFGTAHAASCASLIELKDLDYRLIRNRSRVMSSNGVSESNCRAETAVSNGCNTKKGVDRGVYRNSSPGGIRMRRRVSAAGERRRRNSVPSGTWSVTKCTSRSAADRYAVAAEDPRFRGRATAIAIVPMNRKQNVGALRPPTFACRLRRVELRAD